MVEQGCIPPLCDLFSSVDGKIITVALEGVENLLKAGRRLQARHSLERNPFAAAVEACSGLDKLEELQEHESEDVYAKANKILREYFNGEEVADGVRLVCFLICLIVCQLVGIDLSPALDAC
jgi:importin subunit alpha-1